MNRDLAIRLVACAALGALASCGSSPPSGPPQLRVGRDQCAECGMIISDERCSAALLVERGSRREYLMYDDIGCMLDDERTGLDAAAIERYVHDHQTLAWISAESAAFVIADPAVVRTPMGSGLIAFAGREAAMQGSPGAPVLDAPEAARARREWAEARRARATDASP